jgi:hypothetical protein
MGLMLIPPPERVQLGKMRSGFVGETSAKTPQLLYSPPNLQRGHFFDEFDVIRFQRGLTYEFGETRAFSRHAAKPIQLGLASA